MTLLASAIGIAASGGPASRPKISEPSVRMATVLPRQVRSNEASGILADGQAGFGDAGGVDEGEDGPVADRHLGADADQPLVAPPVIEPFLLELGQRRACRDRLDRGRHAGHTTVAGFDLLACGGFARACHQPILRRVAQSAAKHQRRCVIPSPQARNLSSPDHDEKNRRDPSCARDDTRCRRRSRHSACIGWRHRVPDFGPGAS